MTAYASAPGTARESRADPAVQPSRPARRPVLIAAAVVTALALLAGARLAWVSDDALITLRTALNAAHGWGWGFNATEAVQGYTHPLWFLIWLGLGAVFGHWLLTIMLVGLVLTAAAVWLVFSRGTSAPRIALVGGLLLLSTAFVEYSTSGLENPLGYLIFAGILTLLARERAPDSPALGTAVALGLLAAAAFLTRMDYLLLLAPLGLLWVWQRRQHPRELAAAGLAAAAPVTAWFAWAYATYGYLLPATYEAKTNIVGTPAEHIAAGLTYLQVSLTTDLATVVLLAAGGVMAIGWGTAQMRAVMLGIVIYLAYVVWIGGDFMVGRFLAVPVFLTAAMLVSLPVSYAGIAHLPGSLTARGRWAAALVTVAAVAVAGYLVGQPSSALAAPQEPRWSHREVSVTDERALWGGEVRGNLSRYLSEHASGDVPAVPAFTGLSFDTVVMPLAQIERLATEWPDAPAQPGLPSEVTAVCGGLGVVSLASGPQHHWIDQCALVDRFLATQPGEKVPVVGQAGHYVRDVPAGYPEALKSGDPRRVQDPELATQLADIWDRIRPQTSTSRAD